MMTKTKAHRRMITETRVNGTVLKVISKQCETSYENHQWKIQAVVKDNCTKIDFACYANDRPSSRAAHLQIITDHLRKEFHATSCPKWLFVETVMGEYGIIKTEGPEEMHVSALKGVIENVMEN